MKTKRQNSKRLVKRKRQVTKKRKQIGGGDEPTKFEDVVKFFNIKEPDYFKGALHDALGLYSLLNWKGKTHYTYKNDTNSINSVELSNTNNMESKEKAFNEKDKVTSRFSNVEYTLIGVFYKVVGVEFKCEIFKRIDSDDYLIMFKWGHRIKLFEEFYTKIIEKLYQFIRSKVVDKPNHIMLFGFSMGGNIAQQIALKFIDAGENLNVYLVSLGIGGTLTDELKIKLETGLTGKYMSIALIDSNNPVTNSNEYDGQINTFILKDNDSKTINTLLLNTTIRGERKTPNIVTYFVKGNYKNIFERDTYINSFSPLHNLQQYITYLRMLINGQTELTIDIKAKK